MKTLFAHKSNYGAARTKDKIKYIVLHYTGNATDTAYANAKYFQTANRKASAHYFVDATSIYQSVQDLSVAWSVGGNRYSDCRQTGGGTLYGKCNNSNSISIELCSTNSKFTDATLENAAELIKELMKKYNIPAERVIRHFDVTGKYCPVYWMGNATNNLAWKQFKLKLVDIPTSINRNSSKDVIDWMKDKLNKVDIGEEKLSLNGQYDVKTQKYVLAVWKKWGMEPSSGKAIGSKTIKRLKTL